MSDYDDWDDYGDEGFDDSLSAYVVVGWYAEFEYGVASEAEADAFATACKALIPNTSTILPGRSVHMEHYNGVLVGKIAASADAEWGPERLEVGSLTNDINLLGLFSELSDASKKLSEEFSFFKGFSRTTPTAYLAVDGPLSYGALVYGVSAQEFPDPRPEGFRRVMCQNMEQMGVDEGAVWGVMIGEAEYTDVATLDFDEAAIAKHIEEASSLENPSYLLCARYD